MTSARVLGLCGLTAALACLVCGVSNHTAAGLVVAGGVMFVGNLYALVKG